MFHWDFPFAWADDFFETVWKLVQTGTKRRRDGSDDSNCLFFSERLVLLKVHVTLMSAKPISSKPPKVKQTELLESKRWGLST